MYRGCVKRYQIQGEVCEGMLGNRVHLGWILRGMIEMRSDDGGDDQNEGP